MMEGRHDPDGPAELGSKITEVSKFMGRTMYTESKLVEFEPKRRYVRERGDESLGHLKSIITFEPMPSGTQINWEWQLKASGVHKRMTWLLTQAIIHTPSVCLRPFSGDQFSKSKLCRNGSVGQPLFGIWVGSCCFFVPNIPIIRLCTI